MSYKYDIFVSYKRHNKTNAWHLGLLEILEVWLSQELQRDARIFFDSEDIKTGDRWKEKLAEALLHSRCLLCLWSPMYFQSKWCVVEWQAFLEREERCGGGLIIPANIHDGTHYPNAAKAIQSRDFSRFASTSPRFWDSHLALEFEQDHLKSFAEELRQAILASPEFCNSFPLPEAPDQELMIGEAKFQRPANVQ